MLHHKPKFHLLWNCTTPAATNRSRCSRQANEQTTVGVRVNHFCAFWWFWVVGGVWHCVSLSVCTFVLDLNPIKTITLGLLNIRNMYIEFQALSDPTKSRANSQPTRVTNQFNRIICLSTFPVFVIWPTSEAFVRIGIRRACRLSYPYESNTCKLLRLPTMRCTLPDWRAIVNKRAPA